MMVKSLLLIRVAALLLACIASNSSVINGLNNAAAADPETVPSKTRVTVHDKPSKAKPDKPRQRSTIDKALERNVLQMVDNHLPDIKILLDQLRKKEPQQYKLALRNLAKSSRRLQAAKNRSEESFELEVHVVQAQSSINLLIAKLKIRDHKQDRKALLEAIKQLRTAELARAEHEFAQLESRFAKMKEQVVVARRRLNEKQSRNDESIEKDFKTFLRKSGRKE